MLTRPKVILQESLAAGDVRLHPQVEAFARDFKPLEADGLYVLADVRTGACYCECHVKAAVLIEKGTVDVPLDPEEQPEYRANRELVEDHVAFEKMREDALGRRTFSNIVAEYTTAYDGAHPLKIIGGQHRFTAIKEALEKGIDEHHGLKVYFDLDPDQRLDVQLISNTNIAASSDLFDRMQETLAGPGLRNWCQKAGLLSPGQDFADKRDRGRPITVRAARTFILNYHSGSKIDPTRFDESNTTPVLCKTGVVDADWEGIKTSYPGWEADVQLLTAAKEFAELVEAQRNAFQVVDRKGKAPKPNVDFAEKALNYAVLASWAFVAGILQKNQTRGRRHFELRRQTGRDPLNAAALAKGKHKTDPENYRGLGYRTDAKERARFVELFYLQAEKGDGISPLLVDLAIKKYHAKQARLEVLAAEQRA
jgi:hypothetical protein